MVNPRGPIFLLSTIYFTQVICRYLNCRYVLTILHLKFYPLVDRSPPELILPDLYCRPGFIQDRGWSLSYNTSFGTTLFTLLDCLLTDLIKLVIGTQWWFMQDKVCRRNLKILRCRATLAYLRAMSQYVMRRRTLHLQQKWSHDVMRRRKIFNLWDNFCCSRSVHRRTTLCNSWTTWYA